MTDVVETIERITTESAAMRGAIVGTFVGFIVVGAGTVAIALSAGTSMTAAMGLGAFTAFWGGPGFGGMLGATLGAIRNDELGRRVDSGVRTPTADRDEDPGHRTENQREGQR